MTLLKIFRDVVFSVAETTLPVKSGLPVLKKQNKNSPKKTNKWFDKSCLEPREDKGDREGIPHTYPIPQVIRLELFLESG